MRTSYLLPLCLGVATVALGGVTASCVYERCECPCLVDGGGDGDADGDADGDVEEWMWSGWETDTAPDGEIVEVVDGHDYITLLPGESLTLTGRVTYCAEDFHERFQPCTIRWDFGNGETREGASPGAVPYATAGYYIVRMTTTNAQGAPDLSPAVAHVVVWGGEFVDDFDRPALDYDEDGWAPPLDPSATTWSITENRLQVRTDAQVPGTTALMSWVTLGDAHIEVTQARQPASVPEHYTDIIVRMDPVALADRFYRVRLWEMPADAVPDHTDCVALDIFKCTPDRGLLGTEAWPQGTHHVCEWPRSRDFRLVVDAVGTTFTMSVADPANPSVPLLEVSHTDTEADAWLEGRTGLAHYDGITYWDDFVLRSAR